MVVPGSLRACLAKMAVRIAPSQVYLSGRNLQFPAAGHNSFHLGERRHISRCWGCVSNLRVESVLRDSFAVPEGQHERIGWKKLVKKTRRDTIQVDRGAVQITEPVEDAHVLLPIASDDGDLQEGDDRIAQELAAMTGTISISEHVHISLRSVCVGIDPDLSGAIAVLRTEGNTTFAEVIDVPCVTVAVNKKMRRRHDYNSIANLVKQLQVPCGTVAYVEQARPFPKDGKQGWYITGYGYGIWLGILAAAGFTVIPVQAKVWKTAMGICGKEFTKDDSRALASSLFPALSPQMKRKKDHGRAEALLIAAFGKGMTLSHCIPEDISSEIVET